MIDRHTQTRLALTLAISAGGAGLLASAQTGAPQAATNARAAYGRAIEKVEGLRELQALLENQRAAVDAATQAASVLDDELKDARQHVEAATEVIASMSACLFSVAQQMGAGVGSGEQYRRTARSSRDVTAAFSAAGKRDARVRFGEADSVFRQRFADKQALLGNVEASLKQESDCAAAPGRSDNEINLVGTAFFRIGNATRGLIDAVDGLEGLTGQAGAALSSSRARGWFDREAGDVTFPSTRALFGLRDRVSAVEGLARLNVANRHSDAGQQLSDYQDAALRAVVDEDAYRFLTLLATTASATCSAGECPRLIDQARAQENRATESGRQADDARRRASLAIVDRPGLGVLATDPSEWANAEESIEQGADLARNDVSAVTSVGRRVSESLKDAVAAAVDRAVDERRDAYRRVFGVPEPFADRQATRSRTAERSSAVDNAYQIALIRPIKQHAFEVLTLRSKEASDYGAYTYVIFPLREARAEYAALLDAIVRSTPAADPQAPLAVKQVTNLFEIPGVSAKPISTEDSPAYAARIANYDWARALSLVQTAVGGVLTAPRVLREFQRSPGPFLLTVRTPLEQANGTTPLLLADLSGYPTAGYVDVVRSYQYDLVRAFPSTQATWRPPWNQRLALAILQIGVVATGQTFVALH